MREVTRAIGADSRIGAKFLQVGPSLGGSCFQKVILNRVYLCRHYGLEELGAYLGQVVALNTVQHHRIARLVVNRLFGTVTGKQIGVLGFAFKVSTNDTRESLSARRLAMATGSWQQVAVMRRPARLFDVRAKADAAATRLAGLSVWRVGAWPDPGPQL